MFTDLKNKVSTQFIKLQQHNLYEVAIDKNKLFEIYLKALPEEEKQPHNCNCCRSFLNNYGNVVSIIDNKLVTLWDFEIAGIYSGVPKALNDYIQGRHISDVFLTKETSLGTDHNFQDKEGTVIRWDHFHHNFPLHKTYRTWKPIATEKGDLRTTKQMLSRALGTLNLDAFETVLDLIAQGSLYKGTEFKPSIVKFHKLYKEYLQCTDTDLFCWENIYNSSARIRNTAIGTLLVNLSEGMDINIAVGKYEALVAPTNYKRPKAIVTKAQVKQAEEAITELGLLDSLPRRHATVDDIPVTDMLYTDRNVKKSVGLFDQMKQEVQVNPKEFDKCEEIGIEVFISNVLPNATSVEIFLEGKHSGNFMNLIAPKIPDTESLFPWDNGLSWSYNGNIADSMKERVKAAGGKVDGVLRFSLQWNEQGDDNIDLDAHCKEPKGNHIFYQNKKNSSTKGVLDIDIREPNGNIAVENITWPSEHLMQEGVYQFKVHCFSSSGSKAGFSAELEYDDTLYSYNYQPSLRGKEFVEVVKLEYSKDNGITILQSLDTSSIHTKNIYELSTNQFHKVSNIMLSPNHWGGNSSGNKHYMFILPTAKCEEQPRGFYNEFLKPALAKHKRVFEILGNKTKVEPSEHQLAGLGFSDTQVNSMIVRVEGNFTRTLKINF